MLPNQVLVNNAIFMEILEMSPIIDSTLFLIDLQFSNRALVSIAMSQFEEVLLLRNLLSEVDQSVNWESVIKYGSVFQSSLSLTKFRSSFLFNRLFKIHLRLLMHLDLIAWKKRFLVFRKDRWRNRASLLYHGMRYYLTG